MKVLYVSEYLENPQGGGERSAKKLINSLKTYEKITPIIISSDKEFEVTDWKRFFYFPLYSIKEVWKNREAIELVHCLNSTSIYTIVLKPFIKKPFVIHVNSYVNLCPKGTLIYKDLVVRKQCFEECSLKTCLNCCKYSILVGIKEMTITKQKAFLLWLRYKFHLFLLKKFDQIITVSNMAKDVCLRKGLTDVKTIYYGS